MKKYVVLLFALLLMTSCMKKEVSVSEINLPQTAINTVEVSQTNDALQNGNEVELTALEAEKMTTMEDEAMKKTDMGDTMKKEESMDMKTGMYTAYSPSLVGAHEKTVLFFHAAWCPSCKAADAGISSGELPSDIAVLKVDFDNSDELRRKYEVLAQHTFVQVDKDGNMIKKWAGGTTVEDIIEAVQ